jgi:hypothetical protein
MGNKIVKGNAPDHGHRFNSNKYGGRHVFSKRNSGKMGYS